MSFAVNPSAITAVSRRDRTLQLSDRRSARRIVVRLAQKPVRYFFQSDL